MPSLGFVSACTWRMDRADRGEGHGTGGKRAVDRGPGGESKRQAACCPTCAQTTRKGHKPCFYPRVPLAVALANSAFKSSTFWSKKSLERASCRRRAGVLLAQSRGQAGRHAKAGNDWQPCRGWHTKQHAWASFRRMHSSVPRPRPLAENGPRARSIEILQRRHVVDLVRHRGWQVRVWVHSGGRCARSSARRRAGERRNVHNARMSARPTSGVCIFFHQAQQAGERGGGHKQA